MGAALGSTGIDYSLTGASRERAIADGLANAEWFLADVDPARMRELQQRSDGRATVDVVAWIGLLVLFAWLAWW